ncbi:MAG: helix-turn-helix transcriptional regulator [Tyzzerella sp.]|nr:helix-turn-helix transcriptional regulator [Tyzzerella sp.]
MKTWEDYKKHAKSIDSQIQKDFEEVEEVAVIISAMVKRRNNLGLTQRELADMCGMPQSSIARMESHKTTPNLDTLIRLLNALGLRLSVTVIN